MEGISPVGQTPIAGYQWSAGVAYIAIPSDIDRAIYIKDCYINGRVSVWTEDGAFYNRVPIDIDVLNFIEFPMAPNQMGTAIVYVTEPIHNQPMIVARFPKQDELGERRENQFKFKRKLGNKVVEISGSTGSNALNLVVNSGEEKGSINISLVSQNDDGLLGIEIAGDIQVQTTGNIEFVQKKKFFISTVGEDGQDADDASFEQTSQENKFKGKRFTINDGEEAMVLGDRLSEFLKKLIIQISSIQTITSLGPMPIINAVQVKMLEGQLKSFLSSEGFLKK